MHDLCSGCTASERGWYGDVEFITVDTWCSIVSSFFSFFTAIVLWTGQIQTPSCGIRLRMAWRDGTIGGSRASLYAE